MICLRFPIRLILFHRRVPRILLFLLRTLSWVVWLSQDIRAHAHVLRAIRDVSASSILPHEHLLVISLAILYVA